VRSSFDGTGNKQRKKADKNCVVDKISFRFYALLVDIDDIRETMKSIEGNTYRKNYVQHPKVYFPTYRSSGFCKGFGKEIKVLKYTKEAKVDDDAQPKPNFFPC
jgi:hypothetical protein